MKLDPETQIVATMGSKEGFANMAQAITAPGDVILVPNPTYPIHEFGFLLSGAAMRHLPASTGDDFLRSVERACQHTIPKPLALVLSYPSNPTAMTAELDFYKDAIELAKKLDLIVLSDIAYAEIYFDDNPPPSVLQVPGAIDVAVEFTSLSKTYNMPGWRMGFAVGNERLIAALARIKSYLDYGAFTPIQVAAVRRAQRSAAVRRGDPRHLQEPPRLPGGILRPRGLEHSATAGDDVRLGAGAGAIQGARLGGVRQAADRKGERRGVARPRLRRVWRRLYPHRAGRERAPHPPGRQEPQKVPRSGPGNVA